jgi:hypothetical protein
MKRHKITGLFSRFPVLSGLFALAFVFLLTPAIAQVCDPTVMDALKARGAAEAQRESMINSAVIKKPDSVLALSCFDQSMAQMAQGGGTFSDLNGVTGGAQNAIGLSTGADLNSYYNSNYVAASDTGATAVNFSSTATASACDRMKAAWEASKCGNVDAVYLSGLSDIQTSLQGGSDIRGGTCTALASASANTSAAASTLTAADTAANALVQTTNFDVPTPSCEPGTAGCEAKCTEYPATPTGQKTSIAGTTDLYWTYTCPSTCAFNVEENKSKTLAKSGQTTAPTGIMCSDPN